MCAAQHASPPRCDQQSTPPHRSQLAGQQTLATTAGDESDAGLCTCPMRPDTQSCDGDGAATQRMAQPSMLAGCAVASRPPRSALPRPFSHLRRRGLRNVYDSVTLMKISNCVFSQRPKFQRSNRFRDGPGPKKSPIGAFRTLGALRPAPSSTPSRATAGPSQYANRNSGW